MTQSEYANLQRVGGNFWASAETLGSICRQRQPRWQGSPRPWSMTAVAGITAPAEPVISVPSYSISMAALTCRVLAAACGGLSSRRKAGCATHMIYEDRWVSARKGRGRCGTKQLQSSEAAARARTNRGSSGLLPQWVSTSRGFAGTSGRVTCGPKLSAPGVGPRLRRPRPADVKARACSRCVEALSADFHFPWHVTVRRTMS